MVFGIFYLEVKRYLFFAFPYFFRTPTPATEKIKICALSDFLYDPNSARSVTEKKQNIHLLLHFLHVILQKQSIF